jgi:hypothetical protein
LRPQAAKADARSVSNVIVRAARIREDRPIHSPRGIESSRALSETSTLGAVVGSACHLDVGVGPWNALSP